MKKIILFLFIVASISVKGQIITDVELNKFVGTWQWTSSTDTVIFVLQKQIATNPYTNKSGEVLVGWHKYVKNGIVIESSLQNVGFNVNAPDNSPNHDKITTRGTLKNENTFWSSIFKDITLSRNCELYFSMLPNSTTQAKWWLGKPKAKLLGPPPPSNITNTLPRNLIMTKL